MVKRAQAAETPQPRVVGCDGWTRTAEQDAELDAMMAAAFGGEAGRNALAYLRSITIEVVCGPEIADAKLRHLEGMRALVGIIETRVRRGNSA